MGSPPFQTTSLHQAVEEGTPEATSLLIQSGADLNIQRVRNCGVDVWFGLDQGDMRIEAEPPEQGRYLGVTCEARSK